MVLQHFQKGRHHAISLKNIKRQYASAYCRQVGYERKISGELSFGSDIKDNLV